MSVRNVCESTEASPASTTAPRRSAPSRIPARVSTGTIGLTQKSRSIPCSSATDACTVFRSTPSTQYRPSISTGG